MFTGIVTHLGRVLEVADGPVRRIRISCPEGSGPESLGASIACAGICLTAAALDDARPARWFEADLSPETLARSTAGSWQVDRSINLERPLRVGDELGGHLVAGHVDGLARLDSRVPTDSSESFTFSASPDLVSRVSEKGSVTLDGVSLTVAAVRDAGFEVSVIPHTLAVTSLGGLAVGDAVNLEIDLLMRYVARVLEAAHV